MSQGSTEDITVRLRVINKQGWVNEADCDEAAAEIERLRGVIRAARAELADNDVSGAELILKHSGVADI
jgi:hypothetical protein